MDLAVEKAVLERDLARMKRRLAVERPAYLQSARELSTCIVKLSESTTLRRLIDRQETGDSDRTEH